VNEDWPDVLDPATGTFTYYGDNRGPGNELHATARRGNQLLRAVFTAAHAGPQGRLSVPPILLFQRVPGQGRSIRFRGLLAPGSTRLPIVEQLIAIWRNRSGERFQNYRAVFTVLDEAVVTRAWLEGVLEGQPTSEAIGAPPSWKSRVKDGVPRALLGPATVQYRKRHERLPKAAEDMALLMAIWEHFSARPTDFEACAAEMFRIHTPGVQRLELTRPSRDGGRDALGTYAIGPTADPVSLEFALEAKCYKPGNGVGVDELSRLISRIKHREFGVLVTTSYVADQAYKEIREDSHPIVVLCGNDLIQILKDLNLNTLISLRAG
jgi:hypothetical protein